MELSNLIRAFTQLGLELTSLSDNLEDSPYTEVIQKAIHQNLWFTTESVALALKGLGNALQEEKIKKWLKAYTINPSEKVKTIGIVMAGNIPLVGFHDILCTLISGNKALVKLSSKDQVLYSLIKDLLVKIDPIFDSRIEFSEGPLKNMEAIIATGSDNSARYFEYYFKKYPHIIRKNRNSVGILSGSETDLDLQHLAADIFTYFGLGCRNVSFLLVPENYDFSRLYGAFEKFKNLGNHNKYANNYEYNKAIFLMNQIPMLDNGFALIKNDPSLASPIGVIHYINYKTPQEVEQFIDANKNKIQCVVSTTNWSFHTYGMGEAQQPELWDYADNVDTLNFLLNVK